MINKTELYRRLEQELNSNQITVLNTILHEDDRDSNLLVLSNHAFSTMEHEGFLNTFENICEDLGIQWSHSAEDAH